MTQDAIRHFVVLKLRQPERERIIENYFSDNREWIAEYIAEKIYGRGTRPPFSTAALPSAEVRLDDKQPYRSDEVVAALNVFGDEKRRPEDVVQDIIKAATEKRGVFAGSSPDLTFATSDHWCMGQGTDPIFSDRSGAERLLGVDFLRKQSKTTGKGVNVVIVDQGLDKQALGPRYGGGWKVGTVQPGSPIHRHTVGRSHGMMIAHNILKVAPEATLFDLPLAPEKISNIQTFLSLAMAAFDTVLADIAAWKKSGKLSGSWILVNPWGIFDRRSEIPLGHYTTNPTSPFNLKVGDAVARGIDVVFAAGNCGQFCPDNRCGPNDQGPGCSIWGANSLASVLTAGAVRADSIWLGYSAQGPGQPHLGPDKPDFCAASQFCEDDDAFSINTGTSAACGMTGGIVAALRSRWDSTTVSPGVLKDILNQTARKPPGLGTDNELKHRLGNGILDAGAAFKELKKQFP
jgi:Subtilase family